MLDKERRSGAKPLAVRMLRDLNEAQQLTLASLEKFGWELKFIRHPLFMPAVPVMFDPDQKKFAVLEDDGSLNEAAALKLRD
ncbi:MAG TPA: hypothetical protein VFJ87_00780 [Rhodanobacteraceae bacterium]|jgi:hypothetical protein|nr:hypothetical protein [Rhodanobacteraceae bacterium]